MPRKTKEETELTRRKILDVALDVFAEKGYSRASLQEIADRATPRFRTSPEPPSPTHRNGNSMCG